MYNIIGSSSCTKCTMVKKHLDEIGEVYRYVEANSPQGQALIRKYNIVGLPYIYQKEGIECPVREVLNIGTAK